MTLARLYYLTCSQCGAPAGTGDDMADTPTRARTNARSLGWYVGKTMDLCPKCRKEQSR